MKRVAALWLPNWSIDRLLRAEPALAPRLEQALAEPDLTDLRAAAQAEKVRARCDELGLGVVVETGARYLLDPRAKHEPTLVTPDAAGRARRLAYLRLACDLAEVLGAEGSDSTPQAQGDETTDSTSEVLGEEAAESAAAARLRR